MEKKIIRPQEGFQTKFLSSPADIVIGGGSAGGGKTYALLLDPLRYAADGDFGGVIFRRTTPQIRNEGGLWDTSEVLYSLLGADPKGAQLEWSFPSGMKMKFTHLEHEKDKFNHQGAQYPWIGFDELTHFSKSQFFYLMTRNRSPHGIPTSIRATCNPDPDSWVAEFIEWWIDAETGFPIPGRDGVLRYFTLDSGNIVWGGSYEEVMQKCKHLFENKDLKHAKPEDLIKSVTFIRGSIYNNAELLKSDPSYLASLLAQDEETKSRYLEGNWKLVQDNLALCDYQAIEDLFTNYVEEDSLKCITCDVARFGQDLAVIYVWCGFNVDKIVIFTKSSTTELIQAIESLREEFKIPKSKVLVDEGGVGGGVVDGGYLGFNGNSSIIEDPQNKKKNFKENYKNLKAQCWYKMAEKINRREVAIYLDDIFVDGVKTDTVKVGAKVYNVKDLIKKDLRCFKRDKIDKEIKKTINNKESQKNILGGRSPDNGDTIMMRMFFNLKPKSTFSFTKL